MTDLHATPRRPDRERIEWVEDQEGDDRRRLTIERLGDPLSSLDEERPVAFPGGALLEAIGGGDLRVLETGEQTILRAAALPDR